MKERTTMINFRNNSVMARFNAGIKMVTRVGSEVPIRYNAEISKKYGITFLQPFQTPKGLGFALGECDGFLWFWVKDETGLSYWDSITGNISEENRFTPYIKEFEYPKLLDATIQDEFGINCESVEALMNPQVNILTEICANEIILDEKNEQRIPDEIFKLSVQYPQKFLNMIEEFLSLLNTAEIKAKSNLIQTPVGNGKQDEDDPLVEMHHDQTGNIISLIITALNQRNFLDHRLVGTYEEIFHKLGEFIYVNKTEVQETPQEKFERVTVALLCFVLAGNHDDNKVLKNACYMSLLNELGLPNSFNLANYVLAKPEKFIALGEKLIDQFFTDAVFPNKTINNSYVFAELVRIYCLLSSAHHQLQEIDKSLEFKRTARLSLINLNLISQRPELVADIITDYFEDDLWLNVLVADCVYLNRDQFQYHVGQALKLIQQNPALFRELTYTQQALFIKLAFLSDDMKAIEVSKKLLLALLCNGKYDVLGKLRNIPPRHYHIVAEVYLEAAQLVDIDNSFIHEALVFTQNPSYPKTSNARYMRYLLEEKCGLITVDVDNLLQAARDGHSEALLEVIKFAEKDSSGSPACRELLGNLYAQGKIVERNYALASYYYTKAPFTAMSIVNLCNLVLDKKVTDFANQTSLMNFLGDLAADEVANLGELMRVAKAFLSIPEYHHDALLALIKLCAAYEAKQEKLRVTHATAWYISQFVEIYPEDNWSLFFLIQNKQTRRVMNSNDLSIIFDQLHRSPEGRDLLTPYIEEIACRFFTCNHESLQLKVLSCPELRRVMNIGRLLDMHVKKLSHQLITEIVFDSLTSDSPKEIINWLKGHPDIVTHILHTCDWSRDLNHIEGWQALVNQVVGEKRIQIHNNAFDFMKGTANQKQSSLSTFWKKLVTPAEEIKEVEDKMQLVLAKKEVFDLLIDSSDFVNDTTDLYISRKIAELNGIDNSEKLDAFIQTLRMEDEFFNSYFSYKDNSNKPN